MIKEMIEKASQVFINSKKDTFTWRTGIFNLVNFRQVCYNSKGSKQEILNSTPTYRKVMIPNTFDETKYPNKTLADKAKLVFDMAYSLGSQNNSNQIAMSRDYINDRIGKTKFKKDGTKSKYAVDAWDAIKATMLTQGLKEGSNYKINYKGEEKEVAYIKSNTGEGKSKKYIIDRSSFIESTIQSYYGAKRATKNEGKVYNHNGIEVFVTKNGKTIKQSLQLDNSQKSRKHSLIDPYAYSYQCLYQTNIQTELTKGYLKDDDKIPFTSVRGSICKYGRLHTPLTNCWKQDRSKITWKDGSKITWIDIKNSQPLMLAILLKQNGIVDTQYTKDIQEGLLYEQFISTAILLKDDRQNNESDRSFTKRMLFKYVYFGVIDNQNSLVKLFSNFYPNAFSYLVELKQFNYKNSSHISQRKESDIVFNCIVKKLMSLNIEVVTIHDSFGIKEQYSNQVQQVILECFTNYGVKVKLTKQ